MLLALAIILGITLLSFGGVLLFGAPYVPTLTPQIEAGLELLDLKPGQTLLELGSGDGKVLVAAAKSGLHVVGIELNLFLVVLSWLRTRRYRKQVKIIWGNFWRVNWPKTDGVFVFLLDRYMVKLDLRLKAKKPIKLATFAFQIPNKQPLRSKNGVYLYRYQ